MQQVNIEFEIIVLLLLLLLLLSALRKHISRKLEK